MKLYGVPISPFVRKARVALELKGLEYELVDNIYPGTKSPEYLAISPLGKIPGRHRVSLLIAPKRFTGLFFVTTSRCNLHLKTL